MEKILLLHVYINKNRDMWIVPYKECKYGYFLAVEPIKNITSAEWENVSLYVNEMIKEVAKKPIVEENQTNVLKQLYGSKGFKQFSKKHICIEVTYNIDNAEFTLSNQPRLSDGSYGIEKNSISELYSIEHICTNDVDSIQKEFLKAYEDAQQYLEKIGCKL